MLKPIPGEEARRSLGRAIRAERCARKLTQQELADICDLERAYVGRVERGEKNVSIDNIMKIAYSLGLKASWLLDKADL